MTGIEPRDFTRAVVLGGGGVTGIAWEIGILAALIEAGVAIGEADAVFGTSAGAFVGVALASGYDMQALFTAQSEATDSEIMAAASKETMSAWYRAFKEGGNDARKVGAALGDFAKSDPVSVTISQRRAVVQARLVTTDWPLTLKVTVIDAESGELVVFDRQSGVSLIDAVSASGAVPGVWPAVNIDGKVYIDGGMVSTTNARLADTYDRVVILAPMPGGHGSFPGAAEDADAMRVRSKVFLAAPDEESVKAIGPNPYDTSRLGVVAAAGWAQGGRIAAAVKAMW